MLPLVPRSPFAGALVTSPAGCAAPEVSVAHDVEAQLLLVLTGRRRYAVRGRAPLVLASKAASLAGRASRRVFVEVPRVDRRACGSQVVRDPLASHLPRPADLAELPPVGGSLGPKVSQRPCAGRVGDVLAMAGPMCTQPRKIKTTMKIRPLPGPLCAPRRIVAPEVGTPVRP